MLSCFVMSFLLYAHCMSPSSSCCCSIIFAWVIHCLVAGGRRFWCMVVVISVWVSVRVHCGCSLLFGHSLLFGCLLLFVGGRLCCMGGHQLLLALGILPLAIMLWFFSVQSSVGGSGWKAHQWMTNDESVVRHLVATLLTATWHLEWALARGTDGDDLLWRVTTLRIVTVR